MAKKITDWDWEAIQKAYDGGLSLPKITKLYGICNASLSRGRRNGLFITRSRNTCLQLDWKMVQQDHDSGMCQRELAEKYKTTPSTLTNVFVHLSVIIPIKNFDCPCLTKNYTNLLQSTILTSQNLADYSGSVMLLFENVSTKLDTILENINLEMVLTLGNAPNAPLSTLHQDWWETGRTARHA